MAKMVSIRFLGKSFVKGRPKQERIEVDKRIFYNYRKRFENQGVNCEYVVSLEYYQRNKEAFDKPNLFIVKLIDGEKETAVVNIERSEIPSAPELTPEIIKKGVMIRDGELVCPQCGYTSMTVQQMQVHMVVHE
jgi:hypothetical protein